MCFLVVYRPKVEVIIEKHNRILFFLTFFETYITFVILRKNDVFLFIHPKPYN